MGCTASKVDNEDTVRRCKERRRLMKAAVYSRHRLAAAHADYIRFLRLTGSALSSFATFEPLSVSDQTPAVFLHSQPSPKPPLYSNPATPPPPPPLFSPSHIPSPTIASSKLPHILSASSSLSDSTPYHHLRPAHHQSRRKPAPKLPHILSESSPSSSPRSQISNCTSGFPTATAYQANSNYSGTPSQASSIWNWENFYPPSPPESEFFNQRAHFNQSKNHQEFDLDETETERSEYDFLESSGEKNHHPKHDFTETEREEVQCSEWGDHYSTTSSSSDDEDREEEQHERGSRTQMGVRSNVGSSVRAESVVGTHATAAPPSHPVPPKYAASTSKSEKSEDSSRSYRNHEISDMKMVVRHKDLEEILEAIKDNFEKAAAAGDQVSKLLEIGRAQLDSSFGQLKKTVYHSSSVLSTLSSSWTSKPPLAVKYRLDAVSLNERVGPKSLCSTLERLLAWEKKLYEEVKAREGVKIEHEKKLSVLQSQEYKGEDETKLDKTKTSLKKLQSLIVVTSQAVSTTSTAIISLRNSDLVPQLVDLCHANGICLLFEMLESGHKTLCFTDPFRAKLE